MVALLISRISQRVISEPVVQLAETVRVVSQEKNYSIRAAATGNHDEVSTLIEAFNEMLEQIQERDSALQQAHDELEHRVQERTAQLAVANKELELRNREVERATQMKSKFLASMSHELRTPLNAIVGFSDLLAEETAGPLNDKQKRFVNHIKQGSAHLLQLINDILDLSKIEAGQLELRCEDFHVGRCLARGSLHHSSAGDGQEHPDGTAQTARIVRFMPTAALQANPVQPAQQCSEVHAQGGQSWHRVYRGGKFRSYVRDRYRHRHPA